VTEKGWDLIITTPAGDQLGLTLAAPRVSGGYRPEGNGWNDVALNDLSGGMGFTEAFLPNGYSHALGAYCRSATMILPAGALTDVTPLPSGTQEITGAFDGFGDLWFLAGQLILKVERGSIFPIVAWQIASNYSFASAVPLESKVYLGRNGGGYTSFDGTTWTNSLALSRGFQTNVYWENNSGAAERILATDTPTTVRAVSRGADPMDPLAWEPIMKIGNGAHAIQSLASAPRHAYALTAVAAHDIDNRGRSPAMNHWAYDDHNALFADVFDNLLLVSTANGLDGLDIANENVKYDNLSLQPGQSIGMANESPIYGRVVGGAAEPGTGWYATAYYTGNDSFVCFGKNRQKAASQGPGPWVWHGAEVYLPGERITLLYYSEDQITTTTRLWIASMTQPGNNVKLRWMSVPRAASPYQDYLNGGSHRYQTSWSFYTSRYPFGFPNRKKILERIHVRTREMADGAVVALSRNLDGGAYERQSGSIGVDGYTSLLTTGTTRSGYTVGLLVEGRNAADHPLLIDELGARSAVVVEESEQRTYEISLERIQLMRNGGLDHADPDLVFTQLTGLQGTGPLTLIDERDHTVTMDINPGSVRWTRQRPTGGKDWEQTLSFDVTVLSQAVRYDSGIRYGDPGLVPA
jgi:hypothetical protein